VEIIGNRVILRSFRIGDITDTFVSFLNDKKVVKYSNQRFIRHTPESCLNYMKSFIGSDNMYLAIEDKDSGKLLGTMTAYIDINHKTADIGILTGNRKAWGKGIVTVT